MSEKLTLDDLAAPLRAMRLLAVDYAGLPAPTVAVSVIYPDVLELRFHRSPADFEVWREVLRIAPDSLVYDEYDGCVSMRAVTEYAGARVELIGYADVPETVPVGAPL
ncbi:hypothetical protein QD712_22130 [Streptomyces acidiscabies]|uniref:hypothetical protein n=1 Tax=Streptomyces acidiscabies TaxID=42234 RepID=UPI0030CF1BA2